MKTNPLTRYQTALLEYAAFSGIPFEVKKQPRKTAKKLVSMGLLIEKHNTFLITQKGRIWARRLGLIFLQNEK